METKPNYKEHFIQAGGVKLQFLDWGGSGQPLILIHSLGDSPFLFQELADSLKDKFRIIAYSRRGHCKSEAIGGYDIASLVSDLKLLLDSLKIEKANLLGWSNGGNEISEFAIRYPERTSKIIYFESGYDLSEKAFKDIVETIPKSPLPDSLDLQNLDTYRNWYHNYWFANVEWNHALEAHIKATTQVNPDGRVTTIPNDSIFKLLLQSAMSYRRNYKMIQAPALAIYTKRFFDPPVKDEKIVSAYKDLEKNIISPWRMSNINRMKAELKDVTIKEMPMGTHLSFIFLSRDSVIESIRSFLLK